MQNKFPFITETAHADFNSVARFVQNVNTSIISTLICIPPAVNIFQSHI